MHHVMTMMHFLKVQRWIRFAFFVYLQINCVVAIFLLFLDLGEGYYLQFEFFVMFVTFFVGWMFV